MNRIILTVFVLTIACATGLAQNNPVIRGKVLIVDEQNKPYPPRILNFEIDIRFAHTGTDGNRTLCPRQSLVDSSSWTFEYQVEDSCKNKRLVLIADVVPRPADWKDLPPPSEVQLADNVSEYQAPDVKIQRPLNPSTNARSANLESAKKLLQSSPGQALFLLSEASTGSDYEFTALAANLLEENRRQADVYILLKDKDLKSLPVDDHARFQFAMRKGNAARAGGLEVEAIQAYAEAQEIYPTSKEPISIAYTVMSDVIGSDDPNKIVEGLSNYPTLKDSIQEVYSSWKVNDKPAAASIGAAVAIEFTQENIEAIVE